MNELSIIFDKMNLNTNEILEAAGTKWNFLNFKPGLVGGHCIGVDPYYLAYKSLMMDYTPDMILSGRKINDGMPEYITSIIQKKLEAINKEGKNVNVALLGLTFKENCPDMRNSKVKDIYNILKKNKYTIQLNDPQVDLNSVRKIYNKDLTDIDDLKKIDVIIFAVSHIEYQKLGIEDLNNILNKNAIIIDIKSIFSEHLFINENYDYWSL